MPKSKQRSKKRKRLTTSLSEHSRYKRTLNPPLLGLPSMQRVHWAKDLMPEYLWIHLVVTNHGTETFHVVMDYLDKYTDPGKDPLLGTISSFQLIPTENQIALVQEMPESIKEIFAEWTHIAKMYPDMPGAWLFLNKSMPEKVTSLEDTLAILKNAVRVLINKNDTNATLPRLLALARIAKHGKLKIGVPGLLEAFAGYPQDDPEERKGTEARIRATSLAIMQLREDEGEWSSYFWRQNSGISVCEVPGQVAYGRADDAGDAAKSVLELTRDFVSAQQAVLDAAFQQIPMDLYDMTRQEALLGLIARQFRLLSVILTDPHMWAGDLSSYVMRSMLENDLTMKYLEANPELYAKFVEYGLGQLKLYKGNLQDLEASQEFDDPELSAQIDDLEAAINSEQWEEMLPIHLGSWSGKSERAMAKEVGMEDEYKFLYQPYSIDTHGEWPSIVKWNMVRCRNPLHHYHHLPRFAGPPLVPGVVVPPACDRFEETLMWVRGVLDIPMPIDELIQPLGALRKNLAGLL